MRHATEIASPALDEVPGATPALAGGLGAIAAVLKEVPGDLERAHDIFILALALGIGRCPRHRRHQLVTRLGEAATAQNFLEQYFAGAKNAQF